MPYGSITLIPGINVEKTPTLNEAGIASTANIRFRDSLVQKIGGFTKFYNSNISGTPRDLHAWQDLNGAKHLLAGTTGALDIITSNALSRITPQQYSTNSAVNFSTVANSTTVTIIDANLSAVLTVT